MADKNYAAMWADLKAPFTDEELEWRVQQLGKTKNGKIWAILVPYVSARAIMDRFDDVCGPAKWSVEYCETHVKGEDGFIATINVFDPETKTWVCKSDAAPTTDIEPIKGGVSGALKRAAVLYGIGRYLYAFDVVFAQNISEGKAPRGERTVKLFKKGVVDAWCPIPRQADIAGATPKASKKASPKNDDDKKTTKVIPRAVIMARVTALEDEVYPAAKAKTNARKKYLLTDSMAFAESDDLIEYGVHMSEVKAAADAKAKEKAAA